MPVDRVLHELLGQLSKVDLTLAHSPVSAIALGELIDAVAAGKLTGQLSRLLSI